MKRGKRREIGVMEDACTNERLIKKEQLSTAQVFLSATMDRLKEASNLLETYQKIKRGMVDYDNELDIEELEVIDKLAHLQDKLIRR